MTVPSFLIKNGSTDFVSKQKNLFDLLESAEKEIKIPNTSEDESMEVELKSKNRIRKDTKLLKHFRGKESFFKKPVDLPLRFKRTYKTPDYQRNPHKWVKYSLGNVSQEDMSNESNTATALSFLRDIKVQKRNKLIKIEKVDSVEKKQLHSNLHQFTVPLKQENKESNESYKENSHKPVFKGSKLIMPEYVVGLNKKNSKPARKKIPGEITKQVFLNHIHEYEDE